MGSGLEGGGWGDSLTERGPPPSVSRASREGWRGSGVDAAWPIHKRPWLEAQLNLVRRRAFIHNNWPSARSVSTNSETPTKLCALSFVYEPAIINLTVVSLVCARGVGRDNCIIQLDITDGYMYTARSPFSGPLSKVNNELLEELVKNHRVQLSAAKQMQSREIHTTEMGGGE